MHNFGQGMWRRVGDFERLQVPQIIKNIELEQALLYKEYIKKLKRHQYIRDYRQQILEKVNATNESEEKNLNENENLSTLTNSEQKQHEIILNPEEENINIEIIGVETEIPLSNSHEKPVPNPKIIAKKGKRRK